MLLLLLAATFGGEFNYGRVDLYMILLTLIGVLLLLEEKLEFLVIPLSASAVMVHQGYVFMFFNILLVLLLACAVLRKQKRTYYIILFAVSFLLCSALFLYFELFSHSNGAAFWDDVVREATALSLNGEYHETLLAHEILGVDLGESEWNLHVINFIEFPLFLLICIPYLILAGCLLRRERSFTRNVAGVTS